MGGHYIKSKWQGGKCRIERKKNERSCPTFPCFVVFKCLHHFVWYFGNLRTEGTAERHSASKLNLSSRDHGRFFTAQQAVFIRTYSAAVNPGNVKTRENEGGKGRREICKGRLTMWAGRDRRERKDWSMGTPLEYQIKGKCGFGKRKDKKPTPFFFFLPLDKIN